MVKGAIQNNKEIAENKEVFRVETEASENENIKVGTIIRTQRHLAASKKPVQVTVRDHRTGAAGKTATTVVNRTPAVKSSFVLNPILASQQINTNAIQLAAATKYTQVKYAGTTIKSPLYVPTKPSTPPDSSTTNLVTENFPLDGVIVVAYVCKRVPKSPFPDESLTW
jgi:hypothetical protein